jgi:hypothetical protein
MLLTISIMILIGVTAANAWRGYRLARERPEPRGAYLCLNFLIFLVVLSAYAFLYGMNLTFGFAAAVFFGANALGSELGASLERKTKENKS